MPQILPIKELRDTTAISERCHARREPIFITKNGYGDLVVMSMETYELITGTAAIDSAIASAEAELDGGVALLDAKEALEELKRRHFG
ncbi:MAG: type II toxin-antitoxin system Phd/YefM family antitoxin [Oscillospiraceae bacterium]|nr:type II toxin-antitoxin system Phd/YefM family antitoxin [Oscillospiraceae bacterium]MBR6426143.1 type II toxin-antitoxin system Phd/YefM family antitoxin [Oscillospiraceae bacterium]